MVNDDNDWTFLGIFCISRQLKQGIGITNFSWVTGTITLMDIEFPTSLPSESIKSSNVFEPVKLITKSFTFLRFYFY